MNLEQAKQLVKNAGFRPSEASWAEEGHVFAFSVEGCGPATYGAARFTVDFRPDWKNPSFGWLQVTGSPDRYIPVEAASPNAALAIA
jgi:hypothetical protein